MASIPRFSRRERGELLWALLLLLPNLAIFLAFNVGPLLFSLAMTTMNWPLLQPPRFIGIGNVQRLLDDDIFWTALGNSASYVVLYIPPLVVGAFALGLLLDRKLPGITGFRVVFFLPSVVLFVSVAYVWRWLYEPNIGLINYGLGRLGLAGPDWLSSGRWALLAIVIMNVWRHAGYYGLIFLSGLQGVPEEVHEAARVDGATGLQRLLYVTLPMIFPTTFFVTVTALIGAFQLFGEVFVMTQGGPGYSTTTLVYYVYQNGFASFRMGYAALIAWVLFFIVFAVTLVQWRVARERGYGFQE